MPHVYGVLLGGPLQKTATREWDWSKNGGGYNEHRDFFSVHWEVQERDPNGIRLHVESPKHAVDPFLNSIKQQMVNAILASEIAEIVQHCGFQYKRGTKVSPSAIKMNKNTETFRVVLTDGQRQQTTEQDITLVHAQIGSYVDNFVQNLSRRLTHHFGPQW